MGHEFGTIKPGIYIINIEEKVFLPHRKHSITKPYHLCILGK
jgi:hypothetical protein